jgi:hypothetical protein
MRNTNKARKKSSSNLGLCFCGFPRVVLATELAECELLDVGSLAEELKHLNGDPRSLRTLLVHAPKEIIFSRFVLLNARPSNEYNDGNRMWLKKAPSVSLKKWMCFRGRVFSLDKFKLRSCNSTGTKDKIKKVRMDGPSERRDESAWGGRDRQLPERPSAEPSVRKGGTWG